MSKHKEEESIPASDASPDEQIAALTKALEAAEAKAVENWDRLLRKEAELQNQQKRAQQDFESTRMNAIKSIVLDLFDVADSLEQGIGFAKDGKTKAADLLEGMCLTQKVLTGLLDKHKITLIAPKPGDPFDPNFQEAISTIETTDFKPNCIVDVIQKGYMLQKTLLRPARVVVAKAPA